MPKIYTRTGDKGHTSLVGGTRIPKDDMRLESYGTVDELNSHIGLVATAAHIGDEDRTLLTEVQKRLFDIGAYLATEPDSQYADMTANPIDNADIESLERAIDRLDAEVPAIKSFVLPGGTAESAMAHVARTVCRRAERRIVTLSGTATVDPLPIAYINRLSDYLFLLARALNHRAATPDIPWTPKH